MNGGKLRYWNSVKSVQAVNDSDIGFLNDVHPYMKEELELVTECIEKKHVERTGTRTRHWTTEEDFLTQIDSL